MQIKHGFPQRNWLGIPKGWEDLGKMEKSWEFEKGNYEYKADLHSFCKDIARVGKENGELFKFCARCKIKINN